jgi:hypothetical protein
MVLYGRRWEGDCLPNTAILEPIMSEPNPYEPPQTPEPLTTGMVVKRGLGVVTILLLTPVAVGIAAAGSCAAVFPVLDAAVPPGAYDQTFVLGWLVFLSPPLLTLIGMLWWAILAGRNRSRPPVEAKPKVKQSQSPQPAAPAAKPPVDRGLNF